MDDADINARIEKIRKSDFTVKFTGAEGKAPVGIPGGVKGVLRDKRFFRKTNGNEMIWRKHGKKDFPEW